jgi:hypothetical protein
MLDKNIVFPILFAAVAKKQGNIQWDMRVTEETAEKASRLTTAFDRVSTAATVKNSAEGNVTGDHCALELAALFIGYEGILEWTPEQCDKLMYKAFEVGYSAHISAESQLV